jgi:2-phosphosulfolactate phosphatase
MYYDQGKYNIRCEWGEQGVTALLEGCDAIVIVDVFSFSTCVDIALQRGASVVPFRTREEATEHQQREPGSIYVVPRGQCGISFSPRSMMNTLPGARLLLASQNGATLSLMTGTKPTFTACLNNRTAVAAHVLKVGLNIAVIPGGERWPDGSLRPALEDSIAAGALIAKLPGSRSPEAEAAESCFRHFSADLQSALRHCASGRELEDKHYELDAEIAADIDSSQCIPRLVAGAYINAAGKCI